MMRQALLCLPLFVIGTAACSSSDSGLTCGPGTHEDDGQCVAHPGSADAGGSDATNSDASSSSGDKRVFVTRTTYTGDLGGLQGADQKCQTAADAFSIGGTWIAWLSDSSNHALDRIAGNGPWLNLSGETIFTNRAMLMTLPLANISVQENGEAASSSQVWTGTQTGGQQSTSHCDDWSRSNLLSGGLYGEFETTGDSNTNDGPTDTWTSSGFLSDCDNQMRLYCFEQ